MNAYRRALRDQRKSRKDDGLVADDRTLRLISAIAPSHLPTLAGRRADDESLQAAFSVKVRTNVLPPRSTPQPTADRSEMVSWTQQLARPHSTVPALASGSNSPLPARRSTSPPRSSSAATNGPTDVSAKAVANLHHRFATALFAHGLTPAAFVEIFSVPAQVCLEAWCRNNVAHDAVVTRIANAFLKDCADLRRHFVSACFSCGFPLEDAARRLGLRLASLSLWLSTAPDTTAVEHVHSVPSTRTSRTPPLSKLHHVPQDRCGLPAEAAEHDSIHFSSAMLRTVWHFVVSVARRHEAIMRKVDALSVVELANAVKQAAEASAEECRLMGRRVAVSPAVDQAQASASPGLPEHTFVSGVYLPPIRPSASPAMELELPIPTSVFEASPIHLTTASMFDPLQAAVETAKKAADNVQSTVADATFASDIATLAAVRWTASKQRVVPLLVHDAQGNLISRPRDAEKLRLRTKPHERDRYRLEQAVSDQRHRNVSMVHAPPSLKLLDTLEAQAWDMWGEDADEDVHASVLRILGAAPNPNQVGALDAPLTAPQGLVVGGARMITPSQGMKPLVPKTLLQRASDEDGYRVVEYEGKRLATPTANAMLQCERTLLRLMVDRKIRGKHAAELTEALDPRNAEPLPLRPMLPGNL